MKKIVVVDDDEAILDVVKIILTTEGYAVDTYMTGDRLYTLSDNFPSLVILDILLSGEDGRDICRYLKSNSKTKHIPIILFSAHSHGDIFMNLSKNQYEYFLPKPFDVDELTHTVNTLLHRADA